MKTLTTSIAAAGILLAGFASVASIMMPASPASAYYGADPCANEYQFAGDLYENGSPAGRICSSAGAKSVKAFRHGIEIPVAGNQVEFIGSEIIRFEFAHNGRMLVGMAEENPDYAGGGNSATEAVGQAGTTVTIAAGSSGDLNCFVRLASGNTVTVKKRGLAPGTYELAQLCNVKSPHDPIAGIDYELLDDFQDFMVAASQARISAFNDGMGYAADMPVGVPHFAIRGSVNGKTPAQLLDDASVGIPAGALTFWSSGRVFGAQVSNDSGVTLGLASSPASNTVAPYVMVANDATELRLTAGFGAGDVEFRNKSYDSRTGMLMLDARHGFETLDADIAGSLAYARQSAGSVSAEVFEAEASLGIKVDAASSIRMTAKHGTAGNAARLGYILAW